jgi:hypothetical protein
MNHNTTEWIALTGSACVVVGRICVQSVGLLFDRQSWQIVARVLSQEWHVELASTRIQFLIVKLDKCVVMRIDDRASFEVKRHATFDHKRTGRVQCVGIGRVAIV